jgi:hypothetical protein
LEDGMVGELWEEATREQIDEDVDEPLDLVDEDVEPEDDFETWRMIRDLLADEREAGR